MEEATKKVLKYSVTDERLEYFCKMGVFFILGQIGKNTPTSLFLNMLSHGLPEPAPYWVLINSPGGQVHQGLAVYDTIRMLVESGRTVNTLGLGDVSSMAVCAMQAGTRRYSLPNTQYTVHHLSFRPSKKCRPRASELAESKRLDQIVMRIISERSGMDFKKLMSLSNKTDFNLDAIQAKAFGSKGLIDEIITVPPFLKKTT